MCTKILYALPDSLLSIRHPLFKDCRSGFDRVSPVDVFQIDFLLDCLT